MRTHSLWHHTAVLCQGVGRLVTEVSANEAALPCSNATNKVCYSAGFPKQARGWKSDCLPDWASGGCRHCIVVCVPQWHATGTSFLSFIYSRSLLCNVLITYCIHWKAHNRFMFTHMCLQIYKCTFMFSFFVFFWTIKPIWNYLNDTSSFHYSPWTQGEGIISDKTITSEIFICWCPPRMRSHGGLSLRSDNHTGSTLLCLCPAHSVWLVRLKKISSHCRPDLTQHPQLGLLYQAGVSSALQLFWMMDRICCCAIRRVHSCLSSSWTIIR